VNALTYDQLVDKLDLLGEFLKNCESLRREPLFAEDGSKDSVSPFKPIFLDLWAFIESTLQQFPQLERLTESLTRLVKHSLKVVPELFEVRMEGFIQLVF